MTDMPLKENIDQDTGTPLHTPSEEGAKLRVSPSGRPGQVRRCDSLGNPVWVDSNTDVASPKDSPIKSIDKDLQEYNQSQRSTLRMECLKIAQILLADHLKELSLSPRDNSLDILWEVSEKCFEYCSLPTPEIFI